MITALDHAAWLEAAVPGAGNRLLDALLRCASPVTDNFKVRIHALRAILAWPLPLLERSVWAVIVAKVDG